MLDEKQSSTTSQGTNTLRRSVSEEPGSDSSSEKEIRIRFCCISIVPYALYHGRNSNDTETNHLWRVYRALQDSYTSTIRILNVQQ